MRVAVIGAASRSDICALAGKFVGRRRFDRTLSEEIRHLLAANLRRGSPLEQVDSAARPTVAAPAPLFRYRRRYRCGRLPETLLKRRCAGDDPALRPPLSRFSARVSRSCAISNSFPEISVL